jgi:hypothetical protein
MPLRRAVVATPSTTVEAATASSGSTSEWVARGREVDRLGPKFMPLRRTVVATPSTTVEVVRVVEPKGFDWGDAAIGAGIAAVAIAVVAAALQFIQLHRSAGPHGHPGALAR